MKDIPFLDLSNISKDHLLALKMFIARQTVSDMDDEHVAEMLYFLYRSIDNSLVVQSIEKELDHDNASK